MTTSAPPVSVAPPSVAPLNVTPDVAVPQEGAILTCTACGGDNTLDSRFCRHCGATLLAGELPNSNLPVSLAATPPRVVSRSEVGDATPPASAAEEVDKGRANHFLDRAERLSERDEFAAAILACRQAIALSPQLVGGFALLGSLLERTKDTKGAITAYEHVVELWPDSPLERERLRALRGHASLNTATSGFHFDADELFPATPATITASEPEVAVEKTTPALTAMDATTLSAAEAIGTPVPADTNNGLASSAMAGPSDNVSAPLNSDVAPRSAPASASLASASGATHLTPARVALPTAAALAAAPSISALAHDLNGLSHGTGMNNVGLGSSAPSFAPLAFEPERVRAKRLESSYFWRGAPLAATVGTGLLFLIWAANWSAAHRSEVVAPLLDTSLPTTFDGSSSPGTAITGPARLEAGTPGGGPNVVEPGMNAPMSPASNTSAPAPPANTSNAGGNASSGNSGAIPNGSRPGNGGNNGGTRAASRPSTANQPPFGNVNAQVPPASIPPSAIIPSTPNTTQTSTPAMAPPRIPAAGPPPISLADNNDTGVSTGGSPINPVYNGGRGYIRLHTGPGPAAAAAPSRPSNQAGSSERDAGNAARSGQGSRAVNDASDAIRRTGSSDPNLAFRYQSRALLFLEQGDNARAIDDFNTAIQAYQEQIARNDQDQDAHDGLEACRRGLRLAQRRLGR